MIFFLIVNIFEFFFSFFLFFDIRKKELPALIGAKGGRDPEKDWVKSLVDCEPAPLLRVKLEETEPSGGNLLDC